MVFGKTTSPHLTLNINLKIHVIIILYHTLRECHNHNITCTCNIRVWHGWKNDRYVTLIKSVVNAYSNRERVSHTHTHTHTSRRLISWFFRLWGTETANWVLDVLFLIGISTLQRRGFVVVKRSKKKKPIYFIVNIASYSLKKTTSQLI